MIKLGVEVVIEGSRQAFDVIVDVGGVRPRPFKQFDQLLLRFVDEHVEKLLVIERNEIFAGASRTLLGLAKLSFCGDAFLHQFRDSLNCGNEITKCRLVGSVGLDRRTSLRPSFIQDAQVCIWLGQVVEQSLKVCLERCNLRVGRRLQVG